MNILILVVSLVATSVLVGIIRTGKRQADSKEYKYSRIAVGIYVMGAVVSGFSLLMVFTMNEVSLEKYLKEVPSTGTILVVLAFFAFFIHASIYYSTIRFFVKDKRLVCISIYKKSYIDLTKPHKYLHKESSGNPAAAMHIFRQGDTSIKLTKYIVELEKLLNEIDESKS